MKTFVKIFLLFVVMLVLVSAVFAAPANTVKEDKDSVNVTVTPTQYKDLLILKADKTYMGASVEVHDASGALIASSHIHKKKMIIDFYAIPSGTYTISVMKDKKTYAFNYTKKQDSEILN